MNGDISHQGRSGSGEYTRSDVAPGEEAPPYSLLPYDPQPGHPSPAPPGPYSSRGSTSSPPIPQGPNFSSPYGSNGLPGPSVSRTATRSSNQMRYNSPGDPGSRWNSPENTVAYGAPARNQSPDIGDLQMGNLRLNEYTSHSEVDGLHRSSIASEGSGTAGRPRVGGTMSRPTSQSSFEFNRRTSNQSWTSERPPPLPVNPSASSTSLGYNNNVIYDDPTPMSTLHRGPSGRYSGPIPGQNRAAMSVHSLDSIPGGPTNYEPAPMGGGGGQYVPSGMPERRPTHGSGISDFHTLGPSLPPIPQASTLDLDFGPGPSAGPARPFGAATTSDLLTQPSLGPPGGVQRANTMGGPAMMIGNPVYPSTMLGPNAGPPKTLRTVSSSSSLSLTRQPTTHVGSMNARRKAIDVNKPPFTKEFVDDYRTRMKADPDPEAQFAFAKYLIEAARIIGDEISVKNPRDGRRYRDTLLAESLKVIKKLASGNDAYAEAQFFLANLYGTGQLGLQVDYEKAYHLYMQASKQNHPAATYRTAVCNELGAGTRKEPNRAVLFYRKAAALRDPAAMYKLGMILMNGLLLQPRNPREGILWLRRAAQQADEENPHSLHELAMLHENPGQLHPFIPRDENLARECYIQAAQLGYTPSQFKLGTCYEFGHLGCPVDPKRSIAWLSRAAEKGDSEAELALSGWFLTGAEGVLKQDDSEAYLWARKAANKGLAKAEYAVGYYTEVGIGVKQDLELAKRWYMRAAGESSVPASLGYMSLMPPVRPLAQNNKQAMQKLSDLKKHGAAKRGNMTRPTRQEAADGCVIA